MYKGRPLIWSLLVATAISFSSCYGQVRADSNGQPGTQWIKMSSSTRELWIAQFVAGYNFAAHQICDLVETDFRPDNPMLRSQAKQAGKSPTQVCLDRAYHFSRPRERSLIGESYKVYSGIITKFYLENIAYRNIPPIVLLIRLADGGAITVDDLTRDVRNGTIKRF